MQNSSGFFSQFPHNCIPIAQLPAALREAKQAWLSCVSVAAIFSSDVEDGDLVRPMSESAKALPDNVAEWEDAIWVPVKRLLNAEENTFDSTIPAFWGIAFKQAGRVLFGPIVHHSSFGWHTGDVLYADKRGKLTTTNTGVLVGFCVAPGTIYIGSSASESEISVKSMQEKIVALDVFTQGLEAGVTALGLRDEVLDEQIKDASSKVDVLDSTLRELIDENVRQISMLWDRKIDGDTVIAAGSTVPRELRQRFADVINVKDFGAVGDGVTDDTAAVQAALNAANGKTVYFPAGTYITSSVDVKAACDIIGSGQATTHWKAKNPDDFLVRTYTSRVKIVGFSFQPAVSGVQQTGGAYIYVGSADATSMGSGGSLVEECIFVSPYIGIWFIAASRWLVNFCYFVHYHTAISVEHVLSPDTGDSCITNCTFDRGDNDGGVAIRQKSSGGLKILGNKFLNGLYHYYGDFTDTSQNTSILIIDGNSFEHAKHMALAFTRASEVSFSKIVIANNQITINGYLHTDGGSSFGIAFVGREGSGNFSNVTISGNNLHLGGRAIGLSLGGVTRYNVIGNQFFGNNTGAETVMILGTGKGLIVGNYYENVGAIYSGDSSNVAFFASRRETGHFSGVASQSYGILKCVPQTRITFEQVFPNTPTVTLKNFSTGNGGIGGIINSVSRDGFNLVLYGVASDVTLTCDWVAEA